MSNNPKVRFEGFSEDWEATLFGDLYKISSGFAFKRSDYVKEGVHIVNGESIQHGKVFSNDWNYLPSYFLNEYEGFILKTDDIVLGLNRPITNNLLKIAKVPAHLNDSLLYQRAGKVNFKNDSMSKAFSYQIIENEVYKFVEKEAVGSDQPFISTNKLDKWLFWYPNNSSEQRKIGTFFVQLDDTIALQKQLIHQQQQYKKAMLQKMFPQKGERVPKVRFDGFSGDWKEIFLGNEVEFYSGLTYSPEDIITQKGTLVIRSSNVKAGEIVDADNVYVDSTTVNSKKVMIGDIIVVVRNGSRHLIGKHATVKENLDNTVIGAFMTGIRSENADFTNALLDTTQFAIEINKNLGATINQITTGNFKKMKFFFPTNKERQKIGAFFKQLDDTIALHKKNLKGYQQLKKALLQRMFL